MPYRDDNVQTIGGISDRNQSEEYTLLVIESTGDEVAYIESATDLEREKKEIKKGERISFLFPYIEQINNINAIAINKDGEKLYYFGYPENANININEDLRWHKVDDSLF